MISCGARRPHLNELIHNCKFERYADNVKPISHIEGRSPRGGKARCVNMKTIDTLSFFTFLIKLGVLDVFVNKVMQTRTAGIKPQKRSIQQM